MALIESRQTGGAPPSGAASGREARQAGGAPPPSGVAAVLEARQIECAPRLSGVSVTLKAGEVLGVIGPNGSGKSTLLQCLAGILNCKGELRVEGRPLRELPPRQRAQRIGYLPQSCASAWSLSVQDVVALGRLPWGDRDAGSIALAMDAVGIRDFARRAVDRLSGGEQARVWLARALAGQPRLLLADEPIASLDLYHQRAVLRALRHYAGDGRGVVLAIHDFSLAARYCDRLCLLDAGQAVITGRPAEVLTEARLSAVFRVPMRVDLQADPPVVMPR
jgi:iron complex transport system ATP-binding protein